MQQASTSVTVLRPGKTSTHVSFSAHVSGETHVSYNTHVTYNYNYITIRHLQQPYQSYTNLTIDIGIQGNNIVEISISVGIHVLTLVMIAASTVVYMLQGV